MRRVWEHLDGVLMGRCVEEEEESEVCCQHTKKGTCASWQIRRAGSCPTLSPQLSFLEGLLVPNPHSPPSQALPEIPDLSSPRPSWG